MTTTRAIGRLDALVSSRSKTIGAGLARNIRHHLDSISEQVEALETEITKLKKRHAEKVRDLKARQVKAIAKLKASHVKALADAEASHVKAMAEAQTQAEAQADKMKLPIDPIVAQVEKLAREHTELAEALASVSKKMKSR